MLQESSANRPFPRAFVQELLATYLELAIGDAYGACFEFAPAEFVGRHNAATAYPCHPDPGRAADVPAGRYTDDTQMSVALAEHIIDGNEWTAEAVADRFVHTFHRDPRRGYS